MKMLNQQGAALVIVLITITVFTIVGATVMSSTLNTTKQTIITEENIQGTHLAEMGVDYYKAKIEKSLIQLNNLNNIQQEIQKAMDYNSDFSFKIENIVMTETSLPTKDILEITFDSKGYKEEKQIGKTIKGSIYLKKPFNPSDEESPGESAENFPRPPTTYTERTSNNIGNQAEETITTDTRVDGNLNLETRNNLNVYADLYVDGKTILYNDSKLFIHETGFFNGKMELKNSSQLTVHNDGYFNEGLELKNDGIITIKGNAYFYNLIQQMLTVYNSGQIIIDGDAYFYNSESNFADIKSNAIICIKGTLHYNTLPPSDIILSPSCPSTGQGIYAQKIEPVTEGTNNQWNLSPDSLNTIYN
ncbi:pilus assembly PilX N-terminal domain-containing protein [Bacillus taeanensis]|uniref:Type 4 fimbrial biogenesis protein PilX N-terminal domain-containing protein n=1 Tax=Bacillus taeanensis TaxID=273032 RepID=A0A366Y591_9BACI|nr:pilus assembly PilX N-terminal domain-containing protein [Bacillus taeanensis]RBW71583.1 hypothetical protein DS031_02215 [Bacillus taeanensis]